MDSVGVHQLNSSKIEISVITPVYNGENFIRETINSILDLAPRSGFEYIVVNDGSTDGTLQILEEYVNQINLITQPNSGESSAVNAGIAAAQGRYLVVISADDPIFTPKLFEGVKEFFDENPEVSAWYPDWRMIDQSGELIRIVTPKEYTKENLVGRAVCLAGPGTFFRRDMGLEIGGRQTKWRFVADYDFWLRISDVGPLRKRNEVVGQWRLHDGSTTTSQAGVAMFTERINVIEEYIEKSGVHGKMKRMARANTRYHASTIKFDSSAIKARRTLVKALILRRWWIEEMTPTTAFQLMFTTKFRPKKLFRSITSLIKGMLKK
jgi:glycosyltransferase involved in cell wall biosynthesis